MRQLTPTGGWPTGDATIDTHHYDNVLLAEACGHYGAPMTIMLNRKFVRLTGIAGIDDNADPRLTATLEISADGHQVLRQTIKYGETAVIDVSLDTPIKITITVEAYGACGTLALAEVAVS